MTTVSRRGLFAIAAGGAVLAARGQSGPGPAPPAPLRSLTSAVQPIGAAEYGARLAKVQNLMQRAKVAALLVESGSTLAYFTGGQSFRTPLYQQAEDIKTGFLCECAQGRDHE